ncbi:hypothetical protein [Caminibacter sp.]
MSKTFEKVQKIKNIDIYVCDLVLPDSKGEHIEYLISKNKKIVLITRYEDFDIIEKFNSYLLDYIIKDDI